MCLPSRRTRVMRTPLARPIGAALVALLSLIACDASGAPTESTARASRDTTAARPSDDGPALIAELPRVSVATVYPEALREVRVAADADLQAAIDSARPGDALLLPPGATYEGNFVLPDKGASDAWIVIRTDVDDATLGASGVRMTPHAAKAAALASIVSPNASAAITTALGAGRYRLVGIEVSVRESVGDVNAIIRFGTAESDQRTTASIAHDLVIDRSWVHGAPTLEVRRCLLLNSASSAVIDSWFADCHSNVGDSQAIVGWNGPGPFLIQNNHLEAGHEVVVFGGGSATIANQSPSDITLRGNHITRPLAWKGVWQVKNLLETKHVRRLLVEGNVFENNWVDAQAGFAFVLKSENQNGDDPWTQSTDITIRYNRIRNTGNAFNLAANPSGMPAVPAARITITDNLLENINVAPFEGDGHTIQLLGDLSDIVVSHNTVTSAGGIGAFTVMLGSPRVRRLVLQSNVLMHGGFGIKGGGTAEGVPSIEHYAPGALVRANLMIGGGDPRVYPAGNYFTATLADAGFMDVAAGNYRLGSAGESPRGDDGAVVGADIDRVEAETRGALGAP
jgi:hypothetical protein